MSTRILSASAADRFPLAVLMAIIAATFSLAPVRAGEAPATPAATASRAEAKEASVPFVNHGTIQNFEARDDLGIYIQANSRKWYYGRFMGPCPGIQFANEIGVITDPTDRLDRWSKITSHQSGTCPLVSLTESEGPPKREKKSSSPTP